jgi:hypothetical protein
VVAAAALALASAWLPMSARAQPLLGSPQVVAGPSSGISLGGMSVARDGTGGLVFLQSVGGVTHVFVSTLTNGQFQAPQQLDVGPQMSGDSSQVVISAGNGGLLLVAFINGGELYAADRTSSAAPWQAPLALHAAAINPSIDLSNTDSKAYLAYTAVDGGGHDVLVDYYDAGQWAPAQAPLNVFSGDSAGIGAGRPAVAAAGDGVGMVAWGENGHLYLRRVWGVQPSTEVEQIDTPPSLLPGYAPGFTETSVGDPAIATGGDSSYAAVAFDESAQSGAGGPLQTRVLVARVVAETVSPPVPIDGLSVGAGSAEQPAVAVNEYGRGIVSAAQIQSDALFGGQLNTNEAPGALGRLDSQPNSALPFAAIGIAGLSSMLVAWQESTPTGAEIRLRYAQTVGNLGPEQVVSNPEQGPTDAAAGLFADGDSAGDAAAAWVQGSGGQLSIVAAQLFTSPSAPAPSPSFAYSRTATPVLSWSASREVWGPATYAVTLDGRPFAQTQQTSLPVTPGLIDGPHRWQVTAINLAGARNAGSTATVWVDTTPPRLQFTLGGRPRIRARVRVNVGAVDIANPQEPGSQASGVAKVRIRWGDGSKLSSGRHASHRYRRAGLYRVVVTDTDRAGNVTSIAHYLRILP